MDYVIPDIIVHPGKICLYACLENLFEYYGCTIGEEIFFFLHDDYNISYNYDLQYRPDKDAVKKLNDMNQYGLFTNKAELFTDYDIFYETICEELNNNKPVLLLNNTKNLTYHRIYKDRNRDFGHSILLYGVEESTNSAYIADCYIKDFSGRIVSYQGRVDLDEIIDSIYGYCTVSVADDVINQQGIDSIIFEGIEKYLKSESSLSNGVCGIKALRAYINDIDKIKYLDIGDKDFEELCMKIYYYLKIGTVQILIEYLTTYIKQSNHLKAPIYDEIAKDLDKLLKKWYITSLGFIKIGKKRELEQLENIIIKCDVLVCDLEQLLEKLIINWRRIYEDSIGDITSYAKKGCWG